MGRKKIPNQLGLGLIGCGIQGQVLARALARVDGAKLIAVADVKENAAKTIMNEQKVQNYYKNHNDMLEKGGVDGVMIAVPHSLLYRIAMDSITAGKHVFVEKPMAMNRVEGREMVKQANKKRVKLMVGYCLRQKPERSAMKKLIEQGAIGEMQILLGVKGSAPFKMWMPELTWTMNGNMGGGIVRFLGVHLIDQALWMVGDEVQEVFAEITYDKEFNVDESVSTLIRFKRGTLASLMFSMQIGSGIEGANDSVEVIGNEGSLRVDSSAGDCILKINTRKMKEYVGPTTVRFSGTITDLVNLTVDSLMPMYSNELQNFVNAVQQDKIPAVPGEDGVKVLEVVDGIFMSAETNRPVKFPLT